MRFRILLPLLFGLVSTMLMVWDIHNQHEFSKIADRVADIGADATAAHILVAVNAPVFALTLFSAYAVTEASGPHYFDFALLPPILLWWWWVGTRLDFGLLGRGSFAAPWRSGLVLAVIALAALVAGVQDAANGFRWWQGFHAWSATDEAPPLSNLLELIQPLSFAIWYLVLGAACGIAATRLIRRHSRLSTDGLRTSKTAIGFSVLVLLSGALRLSGIAPELITRQWRLPDSFASISGTIGDQDGTPISGVLVGIFPENGHGENEHQSADYASTDARGTYVFKRLQPGTYVLGVNCHDAPDGNHPYPPTFYPGVEIEHLAMRIAALPKTPRGLNQLRLRRLHLAKVDIDVRWEDGSRPEWSNLEFYNLSYPGMGVIGHESPGVRDGVGEVMVPDGFVYDARAQVGCDAGKVIETRESLPLRRIAVASRTTHQRLAFVLPGPRCELWRPPEAKTPR